MMIVLFVYGMNWLIAGKWRHVKSGKMEEL